jgi:hypothetical protein
MRTMAVCAFAVLTASCGGSDPSAITKWGNPEGYTVHWLSGAALDSKEAAINGVSVEPATIDTIDASIASLVASVHAPTTVAEVGEGVQPDLTVDFRTASPLPPHFYGGDMQWHSKYFLDLPNYRALVRNIRIDRLRFPAGLERGTYDRTGATAPTDDLGNERFRLTGQDVASYIDFCRQLNIAAEPQVNLAVYDPTMWKDMVDQIVNELGYDLKFISAGNEPDINNSRSPWSLYDATTLDQVLANYATRYRGYQQAIATVKLGVTDRVTYVYGELGDWSGYLSSGLGGSLDKLLNGLDGNQPGALSVHWYPTGDYGQPSDDVSFPSFDHLGGDVIHEELTSVAYAMKGAALRLDHPELVLGEFATAWSATAASNAVQDRLGTAIFGAEVNEYAKVAGFDSISWWSVSDPKSWEPWATSLIAVDEKAGDALSVRPQYYVYLMYKHLYGDQVVSVPGGQMDEWSIYASRDDARSYLMLINRSPSVTFTKVVAATTAGGQKRLALTLYPHSVSIVSF